MHIWTTDDEEWMRRCVELTEVSGDDLPIGAIVVLDGKVVGERCNETVRVHEFHRHAELLVLLEVEKALSASEISQCTLYSSIEPCAMCSFALRKLNVGRVVFGLRSPMMGGYSKWKILQDEGLAAAFAIENGCTPEIVPDVMKRTVIDSWKRWNDEKWRRLSARGLFI